MQTSYLVSDRKADPLIAAQAIVFYRNDETAVATIHTVATREGEVPTLLPGTLLTRESLRELLVKVGETPTRREILPACMLFHETDCMVWWKPAHRGPMFCNTPNPEFNKEMEGKTVLHPPLLFRAGNRRLFVWALHDDTRPEASTRLYQAPYFNIYATGAMCAGNVTLPERALISDIPTWEKAFFMTNFTHSNAGNITAHAGGHNGLWRAMLTADTFPSEALIPTAITVTEVLNR